MDWLRDARKSAGLSQREVAEALGLAREAVTLIESGGRKLKAGELGILVDLLHLDPAEALRLSMGA